MREEENLTSSSEDEPYETGSRDPRVEAHSGDPNRNRVLTFSGVHRKGSTMKGGALLTCGQRSYANSRRRREPARPSAPVPRSIMVEGSGVTVGATPFAWTVNVRFSEPVDPVKVKFGGLASKLEPSVKLMVWIPLLHNTVVITLAAVEADPTIVAPTEFGRLKRDVGSARIVCSRSRSASIADRQWVRERIPWTSDEAEGGRLEQCDVVRRRIGAGDGDGSRKGVCVSEGLARREARQRRMLLNLMKVLPPGNTGSVNKLSTLNKITDVPE